MTTIEQLEKALVELGRKARDANDGQASQQRLIDIANEIKSFGDKLEAHEIKNPQAQDAQGYYRNLWAVVDRVWEEIPESVRDAISEVDDSNDSDGSGDSNGSDGSDGSDGATEMTEAEKADAQAFNRNMLIGVVVVVLVAMAAYYMGSTGSKTGGE